MKEKFTLEKIIEIAFESYSLGYSNARSLLENHEPDRNAFMTAIAEMLKEKEPGFDANGSPIAD